MDKYFQIEPYTVVDKDIIIYGPEGLAIAIDYDDVDHPVIDEVVQKMVRILNTYWDKDE